MKVAFAFPKNINAEIAIIMNKSDCLLDERKMNIVTIDNEPRIIVLFTKFVLVDSKYNPDITGKVRYGTYEL
tara:strand:+ start:1780 stop:1995 length:216 start_codon:yes stop_codon:yes gene_type:complete